MKRFDQFISERFVNLIGDNQDKERYVDEVWDLLQKSYAGIGGIKGTGFSSKQDMIDNIPFWKLGVKKGKVVAAVFYKDKGGRKSVAFASDGSPESAPVVIDIITNDLKRSFGEKSKAMLGKVLKTVPWTVLEPFTMTPAEAQSVLKKDTTPVSGLKDYQIPDDGKLALAKHPQLKQYAYLRDLNGDPTFKVMFGTSGKNVR